MVPLLLCCSKQSRKAIKELIQSYSCLLSPQIQSRACQQMMDAIDKEFKKMSERIAESCEAMKVLFHSFM